jgi:3-phenylpropionate/trans-cinnamate dioxygenase ferredoxin reductase component
MDSIVVVGASLGGLRVVESIRREGFEGRLTLIGDEPHRPYDRPPLSKEFLRGELGVERLALRKSPYEELDLDLRLGVQAVSLDLRARELELRGGERVPFDGLVVATGARPRVLPGLEGKRGVHVLRTLDDAAALAEDLRAAARVVVIGAGFIGLEVASSCRALGLDVTVLEAAAWPCARALHPDLGAFLTELHRARGVDLRAGVAIERFLGDEAVEGVVLRDGTEIPCDVLVVGIGVAPNVEWLEGSGLALEGGVRCDETLRASADGVFALGDVASFPHPLFDGERMRIEHWTTTVEQARVVAKNLVRGERVAFEKAPLFWSDQLDLKIQGVGRPRPGDEMVITHGSFEEGRFLALFGREGRLVGAYGFGRPAELIRARMAIERRAPWDEALASNQG